jgi:hypothetical protein
VILPPVGAPLGSPKIVAVRTTAPYTCEWGVALRDIFVGVRVLLYVADPVRIVDVGFSFSSRSVAVNATVPPDEGGMMYRRSPTPNPLSDAVIWVDGVEAKKLSYTSSGVDPLTVAKTEYI